MYNFWDIDINEYKNPQNSSNFINLFLLNSYVINNNIYPYASEKRTNVILNLLIKSRAFNKRSNLDKRLHTRQSSNFFKIIKIKPNFIDTKNVNVNYTLKLFKTFVRFSLPNGLNYFSKTSQLKYSYSSNIKYSLSTSLSKLYSKWVNFYLLFFNIFYYNINFITFSNSMFIKEVSTLNWKFFKSKSDSGLWRFVKPFLFFKLGQIVNYGPYVFRKLKLKNFNISLVLDPLYHNKTLYYLNSNHFFNVSLSFSSSRSRFVDLQLPVTTNSVFSQLFFIRLLFLFQKNTTKHKYHTYKKDWVNLTRLGY